MSRPAYNRKHFKVDGHEYRPWQGHGGAIHKFRAPFGSWHTRLIFSRDRHLTEPEFAAWVKLGCPTRQAMGYQKEVPITLLGAIIEAAENFNIEICWENYDLLRVSAKLRE